MKIKAVCTVLTGGLAVFSSQVKSQELLGDVLKQDLTLMVFPQDIDYQGLPQVQYFAKLRGH
jgi:hypothetical protein